MEEFIMYWGSSTRYAPLAIDMSRNRFDELRSSFHIDSNIKCVPRNHSDYDKLFKVRQFIDSVNLVWMSLMKSTEL